MKKYNYITTTLLSGLLAFSSCTDSFDRYNSTAGAYTDDLQEYDFQKQLIPFKTIQTAIVYQTGVDGTDWQYQIMQNLAADMFGGYFHDMNGGFNSQNSSYKLNSGWVGAQWSYTYAQGMPSIANAEELCKKEDYPAFYALTKIMKVAMMHRVSDYYGPIIYKNFGATTPTPESQKDIYTDFFNDLTDAIQVLKTYIASNGPETFQKADIMMPEGKRTYAQWLKFANSLRLRLAMRVSNVDSELAKAQAQAALDPENGGVLETAGETVGEYGVRNPLGGVSGWQEVYMNASMESFLNGYNDPREEKFFAKATGNSGADGEVTELFPIAKTYKGIRQGTALDKDNRYINHSRTTITTSSSIIVMTAAEVWFLRAEAALKGYVDSGKEGEYYEKGVTTSFTQWGAGDVATYLTSNAVPSDYKDAFDTKFNVAAMTAITPKWIDNATKEQKLERIITQKWLALYPDGCEAWAEQRRTGYPKLFKVAVNLSGGTIDTDVMIRRVTFPTDLDATTMGSLKQLLGGNDDGGTRLWWDTGLNKF
ncbi:SusD/RagB family nutrient-binding outer membrane lipoprotein [Bacteroidaceae bacterium HV4-6-C5C]|nr:SusD/RagB family nutrient-binding outer membrane lipoprotein [Bacteroidaceae bacterium HV4-6-C5C]